MNLKTSFSLILVISLSLAIIPQVNADCVELKYDDGTAEVGTTKKKGTQFGVKFSIPVNKARLVKARFYIWNSTQTFVVHVYAPNGTELGQPILFGAYSGTGWKDVPLNIVVYEDFIIAMELFSDEEPYIGEDLSSIQYHSYQRINSTYPFHLNPDENFMIRAVVCYRPVGGELLPNTFLTVGSWLIVGIATIALTVGLVLKKKKNI
jgi:hypothetical protein